MKKQLLIIGIIVLLVCVGLSGCTQTNYKEEAKFIGSWCYGVNCSDSITFISDKTYTSYARDGEEINKTYFSGEWKILGGYLITTRTSDNTNLEKTYYYYFTDAQHIILIDTNERGQYNLTKYTVMKS